MRSNLTVALVVPLLFLGATEAAAMESGSAGPSEPGSPIDLTTTASITAAATNADAYIEASDQAGDSGWEVAVVPYIWASGVSADIQTPQGENIDVDQSFGDILGDLKFAFMGALDVRKGRFVAVQDIMFLSIGTSADGEIGPGLVEADVDLKMLFVTPLAGYRVIDQGPLFLDVMAGARISSMKADLSLTGPLQTVERDSSETKISPIIASRFHAPLGGKWGIGIYGDLGGFGVTADISWQLMGTVQYEISDHWRLGAGWRHFVAHQDKDGFDIDLAMDGPFLAFAYRF